MKLSIIIPTLNEEGIIRPSLTALAALRRSGHEVIIADGGSRDNTVRLAQPLADQVITSQAGRATQMNAGARSSRGDVLVFLHADTSLPSNSDDLIINGLKQCGNVWGRFDVRLSGRQALFRIIESMMNWRSRLSAIATGDQCLFIRREIFDAIGGYPEINLMEDIAISRSLKRYGQPFCITQKAITSSRRWEQRGILRTMILMWRLRLGYFFGENPQHLARRYQHP